MRPGREDRSVVQKERAELLGVQPERKGAGWPMLVTEAPLKEGK